ncbi:MAG: acyltransferase [Planctomycetes bacterium]|nr:acyltransferase [Planctomycetota bacterium]
MGANCSVNPYACISGRVTMGDGVRVASLVTIVGFNHRFDDPDRAITGQGVTSEGIVIGDDVWIGANAVIVDGVTVGDHAVIGAGAVVTRDVPPYGVVAGNPARVLRDRRDPARRSAPESLSSALKAFSDRAAAEWPAVLAGNVAEVDGSPAYVDRQRGKPTSRAWADAIEIAAAFGGLPALRGRDELVTMLQGWQDAQTGLFPDPWTPGDGEARYGLLSRGYALECLGAKPLHVVHCIETLPADDLVEQLNALPWATRAWGGGAWIDAFGTGLYLNMKYFGARRGLETLLGWMAAHVDRATGLWGSATPDGGLLQPVNGFYRATRGTYAQFGIPLPLPEVTIDTVLRHARAYGNFRTTHITACNLLDIVHPLWLCLRQSDYRRGEIRDLMAALLADALGRWVGGEGLAFDPGRTPPGLQGTEMWLSIIYLMADILDLAGQVAWRPRGVHRLEPALVP